MNDQTKAKVAAIPDGTDPLAEAIYRLRRQRFRGIASEADLQTAIGIVLDLAKIPHEREYRLTPADRPDFRLPDGSVIEIKIKGSLAAVTRQLMRYAENPTVPAVALVTTRARLTELPSTLAGKPLHIVHLLGNAL